MTEMEKDNFEKIVFKTKVIKVEKVNDGYIVSITEHDLEKVINETFPYYELNWKLMKEFPMKMKYADKDCVNELEAQFHYLITIEKYIDYVNYISLGDPA